MENIDDKCRCWVRHAISADYRKQITANLEYARRIGDRTGIMLAVAQLTPCPSVA